jgi:hypothetical protein
MVLQRLLKKVRLLQTRQMGNYRSDKLPDRLDALELRILSRIHALSTGMRERPRNFHISYNWKWVKGTWQVNHAPGGINQIYPEYKNKYPEYRIIEFPMETIFIVYWTEETFDCAPTGGIYMETERRKKTLARWTPTTHITNNLLRMKQRCNMTP